MSTLITHHSGITTWTVALAVAVVTAIIAPGSAQAATIPVSNTNDAGAGSLRAAIEAADTDTDLDVVDATGVAGTINLATGLPLLTEDIEIRGPGAGQLTVRRGPSVVTPFRILNVNVVAAEISGLTIANGRTTDGTFGGAGILNNRGALTLRNSVVTGNVNAGASAGSNGGGIHNSSLGAPGTALMLINSTVSGNATTDGYGAGIHNSGPATATIRNSTVSGNIARGGAGCVGGGGIHNQGTLTVTNSTVSGNTGPPNGEVGGILTCSTGTASITIRNSTIAANRAGPGRTANLGAQRPNNAVTMKSTIIGQPLGGPNCLVEAPATLTSQGHNLADDSSCHLTATADQPNTDPLLGPLAANGGPTPTLALSAASPAVDEGIRNGLKTDQRGLTRPVDFPAIPNAQGGDGTDIGAFEVQSLPQPSESSNEFEFGTLKRNKKKGAAKLTIEIAEGPGELDLTKTKRVKSDDEAVEGEGATEEKLLVKSKGKARKRLNKKGRTKIKAEVTYTPTGGEPNTQSKKLKLKKRR